MQLDDRLHRSAQPLKLLTFLFLLPICLEDCPTLLSSGPSYNESKQGLAVGAGSVVVVVVDEQHAPGSHQHGPSPFRSHKMPLHVSPPAQHGPASHQHGPSFLPSQNTPLHVDSTVSSLASSSGVRGSQHLYRAFGMKHAPVTTATHPSLQACGSFQSS